MSDYCLLIKIRVITRTSLTFLIDCLLAVSIFSESRRGLNLNFEYNQKSIRSVVIRIVKYAESSESLEPRESFEHQGSPEPQEPSKSKESLESKGSSTPKESL